MNRPETSIESQFAPSVDQKWTAAFILELRAQGVAGPAIGAALTEVEAHVRDSGEPAHKAFGNPVAYARSLNLPESPRQSAAAIVRYVSATAVQVLGMLLVLAAFPWTSGPVAASLGSLAAAAVILAAMAAVASYLIRRTSEAFQHTGALGLAFGLVAVVTIALAVLAQHAWQDVTVMSAPRALVIALGVILIAGGVIATILIDRADGPDTITAPLAAQSSRDKVSLLGVAAVPAVTALLAVVVQLLG